MIIALIGSHGTGKTTVFEKLRGELPESHFFTEQVRHQMPKFGYKNPYQFIDQYGIAAFELMNMNNWNVIDPTVNTALTGARLITERSAIDNYAYYLALRSSEFDYKAEAVLKNMAQYYASLVDLFIYFPVGVIPLKADAMRKKDKTYQLEVDRHIRETLDRFGIGGNKIYQVHTTSVADRTKEILNLLESYGYIPEASVHGARGTLWGVELPALVPST
ncbi:MAG TPA: AAA family ATPase [Candidatus Saccharimonadales bacterium]|nr:AAA family ATPase [Candidatus Saccharimonadales bacterium]